MLYLIVGSELKKLLITFPLVSLLINE